MPHPAPHPAPVRPLPLARAPEAVMADILALNEMVEARTAPMDAARLGCLVARASFAEALVTADDGVAGFLLGFDEDARHDSPNFRWFRDRTDGFAYVDRVVVAPWAQRQGMAHRLYERYANAARARGLVQMACEVNRVPPNPESDRFHAALGFRELAQAVPAPGRMVRYLIRPLADWPVRCPAPAHTGAPANGNG